MFQSFPPNPSQKQIGLIDRANELRLQAGNANLDISHFGNYPTEGDPQEAEGRRDRLRREAYALEQQARAL